LAQIESRLSCHPEPPQDGEGSGSRKSRNKSKFTQAQILRRPAAALDDNGD
jgi:hypothetical protein